MVFSIVVAAGLIASGIGGVSVNPASPAVQSSEPIACAGRTLSARELERMQSAYRGRVMLQGQT